MSYYEELEGLIEHKFEDMEQLIFESENGTLQKGNENEEDVSRQQIKNDDNDTSEMMLEDDKYFEQEGGSEEEDDIRNSSERLRKKDNRTDKDFVSKEHPIINDLTLHKFLSFSDNEFKEFDKAFGFYVQLLEK